MYVEGINKEIFILLSSVLDPSHFDVDPDQDPGIHLSLIVEKVDPDPDLGKEIEVDPDLDPERRLKWIRIRLNAVDPKR